MTAKIGLTESLMSPLNYLLTFDKRNLNSNVQGTQLNVMHSVYLFWLFTSHQQLPKRVMPVLILALF